MRGQPGMLLSGDDGPAEGSGAFPVAVFGRPGLFRTDGKQGPFQLLEGILPDSLDHGIQGASAAPQ